MYLTHAAAVLTRIPAPLENLASVHQTPQTQARKSLAPASLYAQQAVKHLADHSCGAIVTVTGEIGATSRAFDKAKALSSDNRLVGPGFATQRWRRIHPFTLLHNLHNQPVAAVADITQCSGPGLSFRSGPHMLTQIWPNLRALVQQNQSLLLVFCEAANRDESSDKLQAYHQPREILEGAVALRFAADNAGVMLQPGHIDDSQQLEQVDWLGDHGLLALASGLDCLRAFHETQRKHISHTTADHTWTFIPMEQQP